LQGRSSTLNIAYTKLYFSIKGYVYISLNLALRHARQDSFHNIIERRTLLLFTFFCVKKLYVPTHIAIYVEECYHTYILKPCLD
jgi:hypothetical protein